MRQNASLCGNGLSSLSTEALKVRGYNLPQYLTFAVSSVQLNVGQGTIQGQFIVQLKTESKCGDKPRTQKPSKKNRPCGGFWFEGPWTQVTSL